MPQFGSKYSFIRKATAPAKLELPRYHWGIVKSDGLIGPILGVRTGQNTVTVFHEDGSVSSFEYEKLTVVEVFLPGTEITFKAV